MHPKLQRLPAERVRHKKRLPPQGWPDDNAAPIARQNAANGFSLTAPFTFTQIIPVAPTATTSTPVAPVITGTSTFTPFTTPATSIPPSDPATSPAVGSPQVSVIPAPPASSNGTNAADNGSTQKPLGATISQAPGGLSTGAIVGITIALVVLILGALVFFARQRAIRNRKLRRQTGPWISQPRPQTGFDQVLPVSSSTGMVTAANLTMAEAAPGVSMPASSYNNPVPAPIPSDESALVRYEFIPSLPDELSITTGETIRIVAEYDDGWALCANARGDQGMVPLECLDRAVSSPTGLAPGYRNSRRTSSLGVQRY